MEWHDVGIVVAARRHGEHALVASVLTEAHGRHAGLVPGGASARRRALFEPGTRLRLHWRARLAEHLGTLTGELDAAHGAAVLDDAGRLAALASACALVEAALPEREPHPALYDALDALLATLPAPGWPAAYARWELLLLAELGFGLDLDSCALTGATAELAYVSPRTGRAVTRAAAGDLADRLLRLPQFLLGTTPADAIAITQALALTGHFLERHAFAAQGRPVPAARARLLARLAGSSARHAS